MQKIFLVMLGTLLLAGAGCSRPATLATEDKETTITPTQQVVAPVNQPTEKNCANLGTGWKLFISKKPRLSFCYPTIWGVPKPEETTISPSARLGTAWHISFNTKSETPLISIFTSNFQKLGDSDVPSYCWGCINLAKDETDIQKDLLQGYYKLGGENVSLEVKKLTIDTAPALKTKSNFVSWLSRDKMSIVEWFIPQARLGEQTYNVVVSSDQKQEADTELLINSLDL
ncbi:MAG: hypothetical protein EXS55_00740 [Candidatus Magasanikbacteria bacterium]|nr:hypothetical protein [Candidatus Magasanikbacteria bacterium]